MLYNLTCCPRCFVSTTFTLLDKTHKRETKRGFNTLKEANTWKVNRANELNSMSSDDVKTNNKDWRVLLDEYIKYKSNTNKPTTMKSIRCNLEKYFLNFFKETKPNDITPVMINSFYDNLANYPVKNQTKNLILIWILGFVEWLQLMEYIDISIRNKFKIILRKFNVIDKVQNGFIEYDDFKKFISTFDKSERKGLMYHLLFTTLFFGGMRIGELLALKYSDIDYINNSIYICKQVQFTSVVDNFYKYTRVGNYIIFPYTKTNTIKNVEIPNWLTKEFVQLQECNNSSIDDFVFTNNNCILEETLIRYYLNKHLALADLPRIRIHDFRHSSVTWLYDNGADAKYVQERMGHSSVETSLKIYNHITSQRRERNNSIIENIEQI